jgi:hypothetical protein
VSDAVKRGPAARSVCRESTLFENKVVLILAGPIGSETVNTPESRSVKACDQDALLRLRRRLGCGRAKRPATARGMTCVLQDLGSAHRQAAAIYGEKGDRAKRAVAGRRGIASAVRRA